MPFVEEEVIRSYSLCKPGAPLFVAEVNHVTGGPHGEEIVAEFLPVVAIKSVIKDIYQRACGDVEVVRRQVPACPSAEVLEKLGFSRVRRLDDIFPVVADEHLRDIGEGCDGAEYTLFTSWWGDSPKDHMNHIGELVFGMADRVAAQTIKGADKYRFRAALVNMLCSKDDLIVERSIGKEQTAS